MSSASEKEQADKINRIDIEIAVDLIARQRE